MNIDIKPGGLPNSINRKSKGNVSVALFSAATFNAADADPATVTFAGAPALSIGGGLKDVNDDGLSTLQIPESGATLKEIPSQILGIAADGRTVKIGCDPQLWTIAAKRYFDERIAPVF